MANLNKQYDTIIIGFGKGGKTLAADLGKMGKKVALIEQSEYMFGGTCINEGCIPSKFLIGKAKEASKLSLDREGAKAFFKQAVQAKNALIGQLRSKNYDKVNNMETVDVIVGTAKFVSDHEVEVAAKDTTELLYGNQIMINTGATSILPEIAGIKNNPYVYTSRELLNLENLPEHLVIVGGGYIGMEFASMFSHFGSKVTVVLRDHKFLPREDAQIAQAVKASLEKRGIEFLFDAAVLAVTAEENSAKVELRTNDGVTFMQADAILLATGRKPNTEHLGLEHAGVKLNERGAVITNKNRQTNVDHIYAMGDVTGKEQFTYLSLDDYRIVKSALFDHGSYDEEKRGAVPYSVFIDPPFSRVGMTQQEAIEKGYEIKVATLDAMMIPKAKVLGQTDGLLKVVVDAKTDKILGAHLFMAESHEIINLLKLAIDLNASYKVLQDMIYTHPTMSEALNDLFATIS